MARYTYRIDRYFSDAEGWGIENDDARGTEDYDGDSIEYAREVLANRKHDAMADRTPGHWRVLVWEGEEERDGSPEDADAFAQTTLTERNFPNPGGRPKVGNIVSVAMGDTLPAVDSYADRKNLSRAAAIRELVIAGLQEENMSTTTITADQARDLYLSWNASDTIGRVDAEPITKDDVRAVIDSYIEAGGEVDANGEPAEWDIIADQLNA